jgi:Fur family ferric uptake transcriptional regulator
VVVHATRRSKPVAPTEEGVLANLRSLGVRVTTPRRLLVRSLIEAGAHRTADELALEIQALAPDVHLSTIYRNLDELERLGVVEHAHLGHGAASYHLSEVAHGHLTCESCGKTVEVPEELFAPLVRRAKSEYGFTIDPHHFAMVGVCGRCAHRRAEKSE